MAKIEVRLRQVRYNIPVGMEPSTVERFISLMKQFADNHLGVDVIVSTPKDSTSLLFEFEVEDG